MSVNLGNDTKAASPVRTPDEGKESKYEPKQNKKIIRLLTVIAYVISVSMAAIILSLYYVFLWDPEMKYQPKVKSGAMVNKNNQNFDDNSPTLISDLFSSHDEVGSPGDLSEGQPTPKALPVVKEGGYEAAHPAPAHFTAPTQPLPGHHPNSAQGVGVDSSPGFSQHHRTTSREQQQLNQQQRHHQQQRYRQMQQEQQQQQDQLTALA